MCTVLLPPGVNPTAVNKYMCVCHYVLRMRSAVVSVNTKDVARMCKDTHTALAKNVA